MNKTYRKVTTKRLWAVRVWQVKVIIATAITIFTILQGVSWYNLHQADLPFRVNQVSAQEKPIEPPIQDYIFEAVKSRLGLTEAIKAMRIIACESNFRADIVTIEPNRTTSLGIFQINTIHKDISNADKLNYKKATAWAINKRIKDGNWSAWVCAKLNNIR